MPTTSQLRSRLVKKLSELFQLDQPDLDFGFYRVMHAKSKEVQDFLNNDLLNIVSDAFSEVDKGRIAEAQANYDLELKKAKEYDAPVPEEAPAVKKAKGDWDAVRGVASSEADIYDHLYRFFERYYDNGDFISLRYHTRETSGKAAPYAIPYHGEEVKLHWANADQYYIKSAEHFSNFSFDLRQAKEIKELPDSLNMEQGQAKPLMVHFRIVEAAEGEHGNVKESDANKRYFILHEANPINFTDDGELIVQFEYRPDAEKGKVRDNKWRCKRNEKSECGILRFLKDLAGSSVRNKHKKQADEYLLCFNVPAPTEENEDRTLLAKYVNKYTTRNTMDYFIHKDLGGFLRRELDFYIKNEVMHLDDIENSDVKAVENYLDKIKVLRKVAGKLIDFLAQLEDFQKKIWLKKKFVVETNYCITLDRVPEELYPKIAGNTAQCEEWIKLFANNKIKKSKESPTFSMPIKPEFLKENNKLVLDTQYFGKEFKDQLVAAMNCYDDHINGCLVQSENLHAMNLIIEKYKNKVKCVYVDPPYNTGTDGFAYKDSYESSSWLSMMADRVIFSRYLLSDDGIFTCSIDDNEIPRATMLLDGIFGKDNMVAVVAVKMARATGVKMAHEDKKPVKYKEYLLVYAKDKNKMRFNPQYIPASKIDKRYNKFIENPDAKPMNWKVTNLSEVLKKHGLNSKEDTNDKWEFYYKHANQIMQLATNNQDSFKTTRGLKKFQEVKTATGLKRYAYDGKKVIFYSDKLKVIGGKEQFGENAGDMWEDIVDHVNDLSNEGGVSLRNGKKPEFLLQRIIEMATDTDDIILDFCLGSGTSAAVAQKLGRRWVGIEFSLNFDILTLIRLKNTLWGEARGISTHMNWKGGGLLKYIRLESYEDALNNLITEADGDYENEQVDRYREAAKRNKSLNEDYMLRYMLDVETRGSQSLLNINNFTDPTAYTLKVKKPGSDEQIVKNVDLIETFNYLIGLRVQTMSVPQTFKADFNRAKDPEQPKSAKTKLVVKGNIKEVKKGPWWFRKVEGWIPKDPANPDNGERERILVIWRKLTDDIEKDNAVLDAWFKSYRDECSNFDFNTIYVNGSDNLTLLRKKGENWEVRLTEAEFMQRMWDTGGA